MVLPFPSIFYATVFVAQSRGLFAERRIEIELGFAPPGGDPVNELALGNADLAVGGPVRLMRYPHEVADQFCVCGQVNSASGFYLLGRGGIARGDWEGLKGRSLLLFPASRTPWLFTRRLLLSKGLKEEDIRQVEARSLAEAADLFRCGKADLMEAPEPIVSMCLQDGTGEIWASMPEEFGEMPFSVVVARKDSMRNSEGETGRCLEALAASQRWIHSAAIEAVAAELQPRFPEIVPDVLRAACRRYREDSVWARSLEFTETAFELLQSAILDSDEPLNRLSHERHVWKP
ncbi:ABC transporter substrate-binding protein [Pseudorhodoplanes sp.]|uniref:ABC transporter substrate-binding protein n=1 Tax=Pseudorhodoplanes sp. TaxID=1934341 RepID=UPI003D1417F1